MQRVNNIFYKRVAQWLKFVKTYPAIRLSEVVHPNPESTEEFVFPTRAVIEQWNGVLHQIIGFGSSQKNEGTEQSFNFILCNGDRSHQGDEFHPTKYTLMMPEGFHNKIRSVRIYYYDRICGFSFFDKEGALLWKIGATTYALFEKKTVLIAENEVIIGVVAKLLPGHQSFYTDW